MGQCGGAGTHGGVELSLAVRVDGGAGGWAAGQMVVLINRTIHYRRDSGRISTGKAANFYITKQVLIKKFTSGFERRVGDGHSARPSLGARQTM